MSKRLLIFWSLQLLIAVIKMMVDHDAAMSPFCSAGCIVHRENCLMKMQGWWGSARRYCAEIERLCESNNECVFISSRLEGEISSQKRGALRIVFDVKIPTCNASVDKNHHTNPSRKHPRFMHLRGSKRGPNRDARSYQRQYQ